MDRSFDSPANNCVDEHAFLATVTSMRPALSAVALRIVGNEQDAADVVQDACFRAWRALPGFRGESKISTWLHRIVVNTSLTSLRRQHRRSTRGLSELDDATVADDHPLTNPHTVAEQAELQHDLLLAIEHLPAVSRRVVVLRELHGLRHDEIAAELGISVTASKVRLHRARTHLRDTLSEHLVADDGMRIGA